MARTGFIPYDGYTAPAALAGKVQAAGDFIGTGNYQVGGYNLNASAIGLSRIEWVNFSALAQSGNYYARANYPATSGNNEQRASGFPYVVIKWYAANGTEVANNTNLSAEVSQIFAFGM